MENVGKFFPNRNNMEIKTLKQLVGRSVRRVFQLFSVAFVQLASYSVVQLPQSSFLAYGFYYGLLHFVRNDRETAVNCLKINLNAVIARKERPKQSNGLLPSAMSLRLLHFVRNDLNNNWFFSWHEAILCLPSSIF